MKGKTSNVLSGACTPGESYGTPTDSDVNFTAHLQEGLKDNEEKKTYISLSGAAKKG